MIKRLTGILVVIFALLALSESELYSQGKKNTIRGIERSVAGKKRLKRDARKSGASRKYNKR